MITLPRLSVDVDAFVVDDFFKGDVATSIESPDPIRACLEGDVTRLQSMSVDGLFLRIPRDGDCVLSSCGTSSRRTSDPPPLGVRPE